MVADYADQERQKVGMKVTMVMRSHRAATPTARRSIDGDDRDIDDEDDADYRSSNDRGDDRDADELARTVKKKEEMVRMEVWLSGEGDQRSRGEGERKLAQ